MKKMSRIYCSWSEIKDTEKRPIIDPNMYFSRSQLSHFLFLWIDPFFRLNEENFTFHLQYKRSGTFSNRKYEELSYLQKSENVQPHSNDSIENATRSSGTSQLASYKEVPSPPPPGELT